MFSVVEGSISDPENLKLKAEALWPLDIGTAGATEYDPGEAMLDMYDAHPNADPEIHGENAWRLGHIHTHHKMSAYFSSTDINELEENVAHYNYYVSLIVNFSGKYDCRIALQVKTEGTSYITDESGNKSVLEEFSPVDNYYIDVDVKFLLDGGSIKQVEELSKPPKKLVVPGKGTKKNSTASTGITSKDFERQITEEFSQFITDGKKSNLYQAILEFYKGMKHMSYMLKQDRIRNTFEAYESDDKTMYVSLFVWKILRDRISQYNSLNERHIFTSAINELIKKKPLANVYTRYNETQANITFPGGNLDDYDVYV